MLISSFLVFFTFLFIPCDSLSWLSVSFLLHVKYTASYRIVVFDLSKSSKGRVVRQRTSPLLPSHQLGGWDSAVGWPTGGWSEALAAQNFWGISLLKKQMV